MCRKLACFVIAAAIGAPVLAGVTTTVTGYPAVENITSWAAAPTDTTTSSPAAYGQIENNYGGAAPYSLAQSWTAAKGGALSHIQIIVSGTPPVSFKINLYDAGVWDGNQNSSTDWSDVGSAGGHTYKPGANVSKNLFSSSLLVMWTGFKDAGDKVGVLDIALDGADAVPLQANHQYIFEITSDNNLNDMTWYRNSDIATNYAGGQAFRQGSPLNGNAARDFALAVTEGAAASAPAPEANDVNAKPAAAADSNSTPAAK